MYIFGHRFIKSNSFYHISDIDAIKNSPSSSTLYIEFSEENLDIIDHLSINHIAFALGAMSITEIIYASSLHASYILVPRELANDAQTIANEYLFDAKILVRITDESEIETMALLGVDGVIFSNAVIKINS
ncbi:MAG: hypothetical protein WC656_09915 [Sulfurimonas sp.]|jgi:hypothetical protein